MKRKNDYYEKIEVEESKKENNRATHTRGRAPAVPTHTATALQGGKAIALPDGGACPHRPGSWAARYAIG